MPIIGVPMSFFFMKNIEGTKTWFLIISLIGLAFTVILGLINKRLLSIILARKYMLRKVSEEK